MEGCVHVCDSRYEVFLFGSIEPWDSDNGVCLSGRDSSLNLEDLPLALPCKQSGGVLKLCVLTESNSVCFMSYEESRIY